MDGVCGVASQGQQAASDPCLAPSRTSSFFVGQSDEFVRVRSCLSRGFRKACANDASNSAYINVPAWPISRASLSARSESAMAASGWPSATKPRSTGQDDYPDVLAKSRREQAMFGRVVEREARSKCAVPSVMSPVTSGSAHKAMPDHERACRPLLFGEREKLVRKLAHSVAVERHKVCDPKTVEDREQ